MARANRIDPSSPESPHRMAQRTICGSLDETSDSGIMEIDAELQIEMEMDELEMDLGGCDNSMDGDDVSLFLKQIEGSYIRDTMMKLPSNPSFLRLIREYNLLGNLQSDFLTRYENISEMRAFSYQWWYVESNLMNRELSRYYGKKRMTCNQSHFYLASQSESAMAMPIYMASNFDSMSFKWNLNQITVCE